MDESDRTKELSEKTGLKVEPSLDLADFGNPDYTAYRVSSPDGNMRFTIRVARWMSEDPCFDVASYIRGEMDRCCERVLKWRQR